MAARARRERSVEEVFRDLLEQAALIGPFDPLALLPGGASDAVRAEVLMRLGRVVEEEVVDGQPRWTLKAGARRQVIAGLADTGDARRIVKRAPPPDDAFGAALQSALTGRDRAALPVTAALDETYAARSFAAAAPYAAGRRSADPQPVRHRIAAEQEAARRRVVLPHGLYGREAERARIDGFLRGPAPAGGAFLITGVGGIGKSALIASVLADALDDPRAPPVLVLDFDRPNLFRGDRIEIAREITRQLGRQRPRLNDRLAEARGQFGDVEATTDRSGYAMQQSAVLTLLSQALDPARPPVPATVAVILDTFEEVIARGPEAVRDVLDWFASLEVTGRLGGPGGLRLLVSGRSAPDLPADELKRRFAETLDLAGLAPAAGAALLREDAAGRGLFSAARARRAAEALQGHPQALRLLGRYAVDHPGEIDEILRDGLHEAHFGVRFAQVFLYTRILGRIRDRDVARLAHPGLVLRRVTPALIREVLAGPCGFGAIDAARARDLYDRLAATVWIVDHTERDDVVLHRRELRRLMLPAMMNPDLDDAEKRALRDRAQAIHTAAAAWYGAHHDTTSSPAQQDIEAFYHRASVAPETVTADEVERYAGALGADLDDLPARVRAIAKVVGGRAEAVSEAEIPLLPEAMQDEVRRQTERTALRRGDTRAIKRSAPPPIGSGPADKIAFSNLLSATFGVTGAGGTDSGAADFGATGSGAIGSGPAGPEPPTAEAAEATPAPPPNSFVEAEERYGNEILALWSEGDLDGVVTVADRAYGRLWQAGAHETLIESRQDPVYLAVWKSLIARCVTGAWPEALAGDDAVDRLAKLYPDTEARRDTTSGMVAPAALHLTAIALACNAGGGSARLGDALGAYLRSRNGLERALEAGLRGPFDLRSAELLAACETPTEKERAFREVPVLRALLRLLTPPYAQTLPVLRHAGCDAGPEGRHRCRAGGFQRLAGVRAASA